MWMALSLRRFHAVLAIYATSDAYRLSSIHVLQAKPADPVPIPAKPLKGKGKGKAAEADTKGKAKAPEAKRKEGATAKPVKPAQDPSKAAVQQGKDSRHQPAPRPL